MMLPWMVCWVLGLQISALCAASVSYGIVSPTRYVIGNANVTDDSIAYENETIMLSGADYLLTMDYGTEAAGYPFFNVCNISGPSQIEVRYAEQYAALAQEESDGPWTYASGLSNTFRVETFNLTANGFIESYFVQGGQRWETVRLLTNTSITLGPIGLRATSAHIPAKEVPGKLLTSNKVYNDIWDLGARVVQKACIDAGNAPATWDVTPDGVLIRGQQTAQSVKGLDFANYTITFQTKIVRGSTGWRVVSGTTPNGVLFILTSDYPKEDTFVNTNRTLLPPNNLVYNVPWYVVNQTTLESGPNFYFPLNQPIEEGKWYCISTTITGAGYNVSIDGVTSAFVPITDAALLLPSSPDASFGSGDPTLGTFGFGPFQDGIAYIKDVTVVSQNGTLIYSNDMTSTNTPEEYSVAALQTPVCLDGAKRDRLVWIGDFYHTSRIIPASTNRLDYILGTIDYVFRWQQKKGPYKGFVAISAWMGAQPEYKHAWSPGLYAGLIDYQDLFLAAIGNYFRVTGDSESLGRYWSQIKELVAARLAYIDGASGLMAGPGSPFYFLGPANGSATSALSAYALRRLVPLAVALGDSSAAILFEDTASNLSAAINSQLWSPKLGTYSDSLTDRSNFSLTAIAFTILSGTANATQAASMIAKLPELRLGVGYKTDSGDEDSGAYQLSPNTQGFLLEALFKAHRDLGIRNLTIAKSLLDDFWSNMVTQDEFYSGSSWEYLNPHGAPGIGFFTSLAHPWGAAPTYVLPEYVLGIWPTSPGFKTWKFQPLLSGLELTKVNGTVMTSYGAIHAKWQLSNDRGCVVVTTTVPQGTMGRLLLPDGVKVDHKGHHYKGGDDVPLRGGQSSQITIHL